MSSILPYNIQECGTFGTKDYYIFVTSNGIPISPFHDVPLSSEENTVNMVVEIPKNTHHKLEISKEDFLNPIKHDIKKGEIRVIQMPYPAHYGAISQTFESPKVIDKRTGTPGDNDPVDVFDISNINVKTGSVIKLKVLGAYAAIDDNETDWKIIGININDPDASKYNDITDVSKEILNPIFTFLRDYKKPEGKFLTFAFNDKVQNRSLALEVIHETHQQWKELLSKK